MKNVKNYSSEIIGIVLTLTISREFFSDETSEKQSTIIYFGYYFAKITIFVELIITIKLSFQK